MLRHSEQVERVTCRSVSLPGLISIAGSGSREPSGHGYQHELKLPESHKHLPITARPKYSHTIVSSR